ncbi:unnamed protein product [Cercopithifilaria johnstoni]|uniref:BZIP domain-containing protein n=1 Tax=Cercopithifilaria johnstoni TaxID=2874296 RepID=A0A8J2PU98_9BILA|nr:unnamed protein product [Cercopithifilaria johnstoni]
MQLCNNTMLNSPSDLHSSCNILDFSNITISNGKEIEGNKIDYAALERKKLRQIRNNDAARRSRQARHDKEVKNRTRMIALEQENDALRAQIDVLKKELEHVHLIILATNLTWKRLLTKSILDKNYNNMIYFLV